MNDLKLVEGRVIVIVLFEKHASILKCNCLEFLMQILKVGEIKVGEIKFGDTWVISPTAKLNSTPLFPVIQ